MKKSLTRLSLLLSLPLLIVACADTRTGGTSGLASTRAEVVQPTAEVREAQMRLQALGLYDGPIDGLWGPETQTAVERFQRSRGMAVTTRLDGATANAIRTAASRPVVVSDPTDVRTIQNRFRQLTFYNGPADGVWGPGTQVALENFQRTRGLQVGQLNESTMWSMGLDPAAFPTRHAYGTTVSDPLEPAVVRNVQQRLRQQGFYARAVDGVWGRGTQAAVERFQKSRGLEATGHLTPQTAWALGLDPNNLQASVPSQRRR